MFKFITNRPFWVNLLAVLIVIAFVFVFEKCLDSSPGARGLFKVPAVTGMKTDEAVKLLEKQGFDVHIQDSVFTDTAARGIVFKAIT